MEEGNTGSPKPNEFVIPELEAYATTDINIWKAAEFIMTKLEPVRLEDLDPDDRQCAICHQEFRVSEDVKLSHVPVKTICGHVFGEPCIIKWLDPLCYWGLTEGAQPTIHVMDTRFIAAANSSCPTCRRVFFPPPTREPMESLAANLWLWDNAYAFAGVARSEKEERSRECLWQFVKYCRAIDEFELSDVVQHDLFIYAMDYLSDFAERLKTTALTPVQEALRKELKAIGNFDVSSTIWKANDGSRYSWVFDPDVFVAADYVYEDE
ncbi:hypothetical protein MMC22_008474 [Lobaria immixta]|nr:hypothetical protein [Lobaria immixta]